MIAQSQGAFNAVITVPSLIRPCGFLEESDLFTGLGHALMVAESRDQCMTRRAARAGQLFSCASCDAASTAAAAEQQQQQCSGVEAVGDKDGRGGYLKQFLGVWT